MFPFQGSFLTVMVDEKDCSSFYFCLRILLNERKLVLFSGIFLELWCMEERLSLALI